MTQKFLTDANYQNSHKNRSSEQPYSHKNFESIINNIPKNKGPGSDSSKANSTKHLRKNETNSPQSLSETMQRENFLTHEMRPTLPQWQNQKKILKEWKSTYQYFS